MSFDRCPACGEVIFQREIKMSSESLNQKISLGFIGVCACATYWLKGPI